jgi:hypothetical protein
VGAKVAFSPEAGSQQDMTTFPEWVGSALAEQRRHIDCISMVVSRIEKDLDSFKETIDEIRIGSLSNVGGGTSTNSGNQKPTDEDMDAIASSISKLNHKVNDVDTLRLELQFLKSRLKRLEDKPRGTSLSVDSYLWSVLPQKRKVQSSAPGQEDQPDLPVIDPRKQDGNPKQLRPPTAQLLSDTNSLTSDTMGEECRLDSPPVSESWLTSLGNDEAVHQDSGCARLAEEQESSNCGPYTSGREQRSRTGPLSSPASSPEPHILSTCSSLGLSAKKTKPSLRSRRTYSQGLRNADGVRLTKSGMPDKRAGNYKYLKAYYDKLKKDRTRGAEREREQEQEQEQESGDKKARGDSEYEAEFEGSFEEEKRTMCSTNGDREMDMEIRRSELEASAKLARERMETGI